MEINFVSGQTFESHESRAELAETLGLENFDIDSANDKGFLLVLCGDRRIRANSECACYIKVWDIGVLLSGVCSNDGGYLVCASYDWEHETGDIVPLTFVMEDDLPLTLENVYCSVVETMQNNGLLATNSEYKEYRTWVRTNFTERF